LEFNGLIRSIFSARQLQFRSSNVHVDPAIHWRFPWGRDWDPILEDNGVANRNTVAGLRDLSEVKFTRFPTSILADLSAAPKIRKVVMVTPKWKHDSEDARAIEGLRNVRILFRVDDEGRRNEAEELEVSVFWKALPFAGVYLRL
jgi:hypothetical protein